jgi:hypothetical protein
MRAGWCAIAAVNLTWCAALWRNRRDDHPWLLPFFLLYTLTDLLMLAWSPSRLDGFAVLGPTSGPWWVFVAALMWLLWFVAPLLASFKLYFGNVRLFMSIPLLAAAVVLSASEMLGASVALRRGLMHLAFEPLCLIVSLAIMWRYVSNVVNRGLEKGIDYLAFAVQITAMMLLLKIGLILKDGTLVKWMAYIFHGIYMFAAVGYYVFRRRYLVPWLLYRS